MDIDSYIKARLLRSCMENNPIRPSDGFAERVMIKALEAEKRRVRMTGLLFGIVIFGSDPGENSEKLNLALAPCASDLTYIPYIHVPKRTLHSCDCGHYRILLLHRHSPVAHTTNILTVSVKILISYAG